MLSSNLFVILWSFSLIAHPCVSFSVVPSVRSNYQPSARHRPNVVRQIITRRVKDSNHQIFISECPPKQQGIIPKVSKPPLSVIAASSLLLLMPFAAIAATSAATVTSTSSSLLLPIILSCTLPTTLGFYKNEYGVSYAYGLSMAFTSLIALSRNNNPTFPSSLSSPLLLPTLHAFSTLFYGLRLSLFLLYRETTIPRFRAFRERIEERAKARGNRMQRAPFLFTCSILYMCMSAPLFLFPTSNVVVVGGGGIGVAELLYGGCILMTFVGFILAAIGDVTKSVIKAQQQNDDALVTEGVFRWFRHPNYTGEAIGWTFHMLAGMASLFVLDETTTVTLKNVLMNPVVWASVLGWIGIEFVLNMATVNLEKKQKEKYGGREKYEEWVKRSWVGFRFG